MKDHYDNLIIGFGKAGKTLAAWLANRGEEVALIEQSEKMYGGSCINVACIPTKSLIKNAEKSVPYSSAFELKNQLTSFLRDVNYSSIEKLALASVITAEARFCSPNEVELHVKGAGNPRRIHANRIFINTGTQAYLPPIAGLLESKKVFTSTQLLDQAQLVKKLIIIGGGFIGVEFASMYAQFGAQVTILEKGPVFLPKEDEDVAAELLKQLNEKNAQVLTGITIERIQDLGHDQVAVNYRNQRGDSCTMKASAILIATGRRPTTARLNVASAGIKVNEQGYIEVDEHLKTTAPSIWALGDCNGGPQFTYISLDDFRIIRGQLSDGKYTSVKQ